MPNWCATNYLLRGPKEKIQDFCNKVNSCVDKPDVLPNSFGKLWLGNLYAVFENETDQKTIMSADIRGCLDPDPESEPCLFGPEGNVQYLYPEKDIQTGEKDWMHIAFSTQTAWDMSRWLNRMLKEKYPELEVSFKTTDEFGNFHKCHNPGRMGIKRIEIWHHDHEEYFLDSAEEAADLILNISGLDFAKEDIENESEEFCRKINEYNENHEDEELEITVWKFI